MSLNSKVALLLLGVLVGGVFAYVTRQPPAVIRFGDGQAVQFDNNMVTTGSAQAVTAAQFQRVIIYAFGGGLAGLAIGFAADRRR